MRLPNDTVLQHRYVIQRRLGEGGIGTAYLARDLLRETTVTLKLLRHIDPDLVEAFRAEFMTLRGVVHPHVCQVHDFGAVRAGSGAISYFYTAEYVDGCSLDRRVQGRTWQESAGLLAQALDGLRLLHGIGVLHGDFKPENILVSSDDRVVLIDLSCSAPLGTRGDRAVSGTSGYIAPERMSDQPIDSRADLYAVGKTILALSGSLREPLPAPVRALAERLSNDSPRKRPADVNEVMEVLFAGKEAAAPPSVPPPRLLGRSAELNAFQGCLDDLIIGRSGRRCLLVCGPEGAGRTRLLQEMKWTAQLYCAVIEGYAPGADPIMTMLRRATADAALPSGLQGVLQARDQLLARAEAMVLLIDDADLMPNPEKELLFGLIRILDPKDPLLVVCSLVEEPPIPRTHARSLALGPLREENIEAWAGDRVAPRDLPDIMRLTGGFPSSVHALLSLLGAGAASRQKLRHLAGRVPLSDRRIDSIRALSAVERRLLALIALMDGVLDGADARALCPDREALGELIQKGWARAESGGFKLLRAGEIPRILEAIEPRIAMDLHRVAADRLRERIAALKPETTAASDQMTRLIHHLVRSGALDEARSLYLDNTPLHERYPSLWAPAAQTLARARPEPDLLLRAAQICEAAGMFDAAIALLETLRRSRPSAEWMCRAYIQVGACYLRRGEPGRALRYLKRAIKGARQGDLRARAIDLTCRALIRQGDYVPVRGLVDEALRICTTPEVQADLHEDAGVVATYSGDFDAARRSFKASARLHGGAANAQAQIRLASCNALNEYRAGNTLAAARGYRVELDIAERLGTSHQVASAVLNLGAACHQLGDLGQALALYERGLRMVVALGASSTEVKLRNNIAKLYADIGVFERASAAAERAIACAEQVSARFSVGTALIERGSIAALMGRHDRAIQDFDLAREELAAQRASREVSEVELHLAEVWLAKEDVAAASDALARAVASVRQHAAEDLAARVEMTRGRILLAQEHGAAALDRLEDAFNLAQPTGQRGLQALIARWLAVACEKQGSFLLAERHRSVARELWERMAASLPKTYKEAFWSHPERGGVRAAEGPPAHTSLRERKLERLIEINKRLCSSLDATNILSCALDSAIELTAAERGFVLVIAATGDELSVAIARNMDHERVGNRNTKFSRSIAERVISTGSPVMTSNAQTDPRFTGRHSIHAMRLRSVVSVPIRSVKGVLGALYLDHRFQAGIFNEEDVEILMAFADQVAIALENARLHADLAQHREDLLRERQRIEQLLRGQTEEIERLTLEVRATREILQSRYDYSAIVGRSAAMKSVLARLDRVIGTTLSVLIQGESGTGKELVARAIHYNGPRRDGPFLAINCAAIPEALLESELFGHAKGAFTGAVQAKVGLFVAARGGTLFLDELGELPLGMQAKLLRALQEREVRPVASTEAIPIDIHLVCATNRRLIDEVARGKFRSDLFYRIRVVEIPLPPLRERIEDIPDLARHFLERFAAEHGRSARQLSRQAMRALMSHTWPGNVRELENVLMNAALLADGDTLTMSDLALNEGQSQIVGDMGRSGFQDRESKRIEAALVACSWNVSEVSRMLQIPRTTLYRKLKRLK